MTETAKPLVIKSSATTLAMEAVYDIIELTARLSAATIAKVQRQDGTDFW